jgi:hypothetical protein
MLLGPPVRSVAAFARVLHPIPNTTCVRRGRYVPVAVAFAGGTLVAQSARPPCLPDTFSLQPGPHQEPVWIAQSSVRPPSKSESQG